MPKPNEKNVGLILNRTQPIKNINGYTDRNDTKKIAKELKNTKRLIIEL